MKSEEARGKLSLAAVVEIAERLADFTESERTRILNTVAVFFDYEPQGEG